MTTLLHDEVKPLGMSLIMSRSGGTGNQRTIRITRVTPKGFM